jgi:uncharacterized glyoxalase superfamily protein PhnB
MIGNEPNAKPQPPMINRSMPESVIIPELVYPNISEAVTWLCDVFGFKERLRIGNHRAQLLYNHAAVIVTQRSVDLDPSIEVQKQTPTHSIMVRVEDIEQHYAQALQRGANIINPPTEYPYGEKQYTVLDPGGHIWTFSQSIADVDPAAWGGKLHDRG